jgi:hypothetical protein
MWRRIAAELCRANLAGTPGWAAGDWTRRHELPKQLIDAQSIRDVLILRAPGHGNCKGIRRRRRKRKSHPQGLAGGSML